MITRRSFVAKTTRTLSAFAASRPSMWLPLTRAVRRTVPAVWFKDPTPAEHFQWLAQQAIDAGRQAGAEFVDIRIGESRSFSVTTYPTAEITTSAAYGIRVLVDGMWGVAHGELLTVDAITDCAREAVVAAQGYAAVNNRTGGARVVLMSAPRQTGEWTSPLTVSPFTTPLDDHTRVVDSWRQVTAPYIGCGIDTATVTWTGETRVVATSEGTLVTQYLTRVDPVVIMECGNMTSLRVPALIPATGGFERMIGPDVPDQIRATVDDVLRLSQVPRRPFGEVGRFPVVLDGQAAAIFLGTTLGAALDADRVTGLEADAAGGSFLHLSDTAPLSPLVSVSADREAPAYTAARWDDEGVLSVSQPVIAGGQVRSYLTTRETASMLSTSNRLLGVAVAPTPSQTVMAGGAHLTLSPASGSVSLDALIAPMTHGIVCYGGTCLPEPGLSTGVLDSPLMFEVRHGQIVARVTDVIFQFQTRQWWTQRLTALGDMSTARTVLVQMEKGMPWQAISQGATAPAMLLTDIDVINRQVSR